MPRKFDSALVVLLVLASAGCAKKVDVEASRTELRTLDAEWSSATNNIDTFMNYVAADASFYPPNQAVVTGADAVRTFMTGTIALPGYSLSWQPTTVDVASSGDLGYTAGTYQFTVTGPDGGPMNDTGKYVAVWKKDAGGGWKVVADIFNSDLPMPSMPASADTTAIPPTGG